MKERVSPAPLLEARKIHKTFMRGKWPFVHSRLLAVNDVSVKIFPHDTLALAGESGAGKSTLARCLTLLERPDSGAIDFDGKDLLRLPRRSAWPERRQIQIVFQHSGLAFNPRLSALQIVSEPLLIQREGNKREREDRSLSVMAQVGLPAELRHRLPHEFSGGQRRRLAIARALVLEPKLLILDEPLSGLDAIHQLRIANLLRALQDSLHLSYLFITHDLNMAAYMAETLAVMHRGTIVEAGSMRDVLSRPQHPQTQKLVHSLSSTARPRAASNPSAQ